MKLGGLNNYKFLYFKAIQFRNETIFTYFCFSNTWALSQSHHTLTGCAVRLVLLRLAEDFKGLWLFEKRPLSMSHFHFLTSSFLTILKTHWIMLFMHCFLSLQFWRVFWDIFDWLTHLTWKDELIYLKVVTFSFKPTYFWILCY